MAEKELAHAPVLHSRLQVAHAHGLRSGLSLPPTHSAGIGSDGDKKEIPENGHGKPFLLDSSFDGLHNRGGGSK